jgi:MoaA/NifB/PqqE/SkfB family radical SAM enzyme
MANLVYPPADWEKDQSGLFPTFVVPAAHGCNLRCSFCIIAQRQEIREEVLNPFHYSLFLSQIAAVRPVAGMAIQGYEPLLPEAMPYTRALLSAARLREIPASVVTNGVLLRQAAAELADLQPKRVGVSLDSFMPERHDRLRGVKGAWAETIRGIEEGARRFAQSGVGLQVISVLMPGRAGYLRDMPELLNRMGVQDWIINPVVRVSPNQAAHFSASGSRIAEDLRELAVAAEGSNINLIVDDEFGFLDPFADGEDFHGLNVRSLPKQLGVIRLTPGGECMMNAELRRIVPPDAPRWTPRQHAGQFVRLLENDGATFKRAA